MDQHFLEFPNKRTTSRGFHLAFLRSFRDFQLNGFNNFLTFWKLLPETFQYSLSLFRNFRNFWLNGKRIVLNTPCPETAVFGHAHRRGRALRTRFSRLFQQNCMETWERYIDTCLNGKFMSLFNLLFLQECNAEKSYVYRQFSFCYGE